MRDVEEVENAAVSWAQAAADWRRNNALNVAAKRKVEEAQLAQLASGSLGQNSDGASAPSMVDLREADQALRV